MDTDTVRVASSAFDGADSGDTTAQRASARDTIVILRVIIFFVDGWDKAFRKTAGEDDDGGDDDARGVRDNEDVDDGRRGVTRRAQQTRTHD